MVKKINLEEQEKNLAQQIPDFDRKPTMEPEKLDKKFLGAKQGIDKDMSEDFERSTHGTMLGENIFVNAEARQGWIAIDRALLGERSMFYPEDWVFLVRPATVEAIRNWSMIDEKNGNSIDEVFNEILKYCLSIKTSTGNMPWQAINEWDRFFFVLLIREYTFVNGEAKLEFYEDCPECDTPMQYTLNSQSLMYDMPDESVMKYYDAENRVWVIDPEEFNLNYGKEIVCYLPTLEKSANIKSVLISQYQENPNKKFDTVFLKFLPWMTAKISKDVNIAKTQIRKLEMVYRGWDKETFMFMDDIIRNIVVTPSTNMSAVCKACGEEATTPIRFPNGISSLFTMDNRHSKFGTK